MSAPVSGVEYIDLLPEKQELVVAVTNALPLLQRPTLQNHLGNMPLGLTKKS